MDPLTTSMSDTFEFEFVQRRQEVAAATTLGNTLKFLFQTVPHNCSSFSTNCTNTIRIYQFINTPCDKRLH